MPDDGNAVTATELVVKKSGICMRVADYSVDVLFLTASSLWRLEAFKKRNIRLNMPSENELEISTAVVYLWRLFGLQ